MKGNHRIIVGVILILTVLSALWGAAAWAEECTHPNLGSEYTCDPGGSTHYILCPDCGARVNEENHYMSCSAPDVCYVCRTAFSDYDNVRHTPINDGAYTITENFHYQECSVCNRQLNMGPHRAMCSKPGVCGVCNAEYTGSNIMHSLKNDGAYTVDGGMHYQECTECDVHLNEKAHYALCNTPTVCMICNATYPCTDIRHMLESATLFYDNIEHYYQCSYCDAHASAVAHTLKNNGAYTVDGDKHYQECNEYYCYAHINEGTHYALCNDNSKCAVCGTTYSGDDVRHALINDGAYTVEEYFHYQECTLCGHVNEGEHYALCTSPGTCAVCGTECGDDYIMHTLKSDSEYSVDETYHWFECTSCNRRVEEGKHSSMCDDLGNCSVCYAVYNGDEIRHMLKNDGAYASDGEMHYQECENCSQRINEGKHYALCTDTEKCAVCGATYTGDDVRHTLKNDGAYVASENSHYQGCQTCDARINETEHYALCTNPGVCAVCGAAFTGGKIEHSVGDPKQYVSEANAHYVACLQCDAHIDEAAHEFDDMDVCTVCGYQLVHTHDVDSSKWIVGVDTHYHACSGCDEHFDEMAHTASCVAPAGVCEVCGGAYTGAVTHNINWNAYLTNDNAHFNACADCRNTYNFVKHNWRLTETVEAVCEKDGYTAYACTVCDRTKQEAIPALAHTYGNFAAKGDGTHEAVCTNSCGAALTKPCAYNVTVLGTLSTSVCGVCGHTITQTIIMPEGTETALPSMESVTEAVKLESAVIETAGETALPEDAKMNTLVQTAKVANSEQTAQIFTVSIDVEGEAYTPEAPVRVSIPLTVSAPEVQEQFAPLFETLPSDDAQPSAELESMKALLKTAYRLVLIKPDGTIVDIEYDIVNGMLVFDTSELGVFAFLPIAEGEAA